MKSPAQFSAEINSRAYARREIVIVSRRQIKEIIGMSHLRKLSVIGMAILTSAQAVCAPASYKLTDNENNRECSAVLDALERARLVAKSDRQICEIMNSPVTDLLQGKDFRDVEWVLATAVTQSEKEVIAKQIYESKIETSRLNLFAKNESSYILGVKEILSKDDVIVEHAELKYGQKVVYAVQLRRKQCDADYNVHGDIPVWGLFADKSQAKGLPSSPWMAAGNLFYLDGHLLTVSILPDFWQSESSLSNKKTELSVNIWSMDANVSANSDISFTTQLVCNISIHR